MHRTVLNLVASFGLGPVVLLVHRHELTMLQGWARMIRCSKRACTHCCCHYSSSRTHCWAAVCVSQAISRNTCIASYFLPWQGACRRMPFVCSLLAVCQRSYALALQHLPVVNTLCCAVWIAAGTGRVLTRPSPAQPGCGGFALVKAHAALLHCWFAAFA